MSRLNTLSSITAVNNRGALIPSIAGREQHKPRAKKSRIIMKTTKYNVLKWGMPI
jgi:hypothetical protein